MTFRHRYSAHPTSPILSSGDLDAIDDIRVEWEQHRKDRAPDCSQIIEIALRRMQLDLDSGSGDVIEDLRREIGYRQWCTRAVSAASVPMHGRGPV
jgi:hypothetical protein